MNAEGRLMRDLPRWGGGGIWRHLRILAPPYRIKSHVAREAEQHGKRTKLEKLHDAAERAQWNKPQFEDPQVRLKPRLIVSIEKFGLDHSKYQHVPRNRDDVILNFSWEISTLPRRGNNAREARPEHHVNLLGQFIPLLGAHTRHVKDLITQIKQIILRV